MAQAGNKKKKTQEAAQSTDRAGFLLLPLGLVILALGFMLALGITLQTSSYALYFFKQAATGTGGMLTYAVPAFVLWLGALLCASSKRHVSVSLFAESLLLLLAVSAMMNLTLRVFDTPFMEYIGLNARSLGDFVRAPFRIDNGILSLSGGAMGMLLAYPLYRVAGTIGAAVIDGLAIIALLFALPRVSPARLYRTVSGTLARVPVTPVPAAAVAEAAAPDTQPLFPERDTAAPEPAVPHPAAASAPPVRPVAPPPRKRAEEAPVPGFVPQPAAAMSEAPFVVSKPSVILPPEPAASPAWPGVAAAVLENEPAQPPPARPARRAAPKAKPSDEAPNPQPTEREIQPARAAAAERPAAQAASAAAAKPEKPAPAARISVEPAAAKPAREKNPLPFTPGLDGMARQQPTAAFASLAEDYEMPPLRLLTAPPAGSAADTTQEDTLRAQKLIDTLDSFSIPATMQEIVHGPTVTRFSIRLAEGVNVNRLRSVMDNLTVELKARGDIRAEIPIPGTSFVGLEVSNDRPSKVFLREVLESAPMRNNPSPTCVALGRDITGNPITCELMEMPHLLIAGATGSGKSVCINSIICSLLYRSTPRQVRLLMVDPKFVELQPYNEVPHLLMPVVTDVKKAALALDWICRMMDDRYQILMKAGARNLDAYNAKLGEGEEPLPRIVVIVDEMADLMTTNGKLIEDHVKRITAKARAAGISLIMATQRPSVNIITGVIKANMPARVAFRVSASFDSRTILDGQGAEKLLGHGDMLFRPSAQTVRVQGCFVADRDVEQTVEHIRSRSPADYEPDLLEYTEKTEQNENAAQGDAQDGGGEYDDKLPEAIEMAVEAGQMSISMLQRVLRVGYARAGRLIDEMARRGVISGNEGTKARKTLMTREQYYAELEKTGGKL
ncbi:MAG TPA: DNA translocase FtsK [Candidatus Limnocylindria bacterium]|nr:DNA translocase FtsK [Candidatus Limnocylindria bacterium]